jgi:hypothetical protein
MKKFLAQLVVSLFISLCLQAQVTEVKYLSGYDAGHTVQWDFFCTSGRNSMEWKKINVPSCWEQQGFGNYNYGRDYKTNGKNARFNDEKGMYKHEFSVPLTWRNKQIEIFFEGSMTDTEVKINGRSVGATHQGAFYRFKYDITTFLNYGKNNLLEVSVSKMSSDPSVNNAERLADYWVFGGIYRPVYLEAKPKENIRYVGIDAESNGDFKMQVVAANINKTKNIRAIIRDSKGNLVKEINRPVSKNDSIVLINSFVKNISTWTSETPVLYSVEVSLLDVNRKKIGEQKEKFGFRTIEVRRGEGVYINGTQVKFKGVNRHCFWPETGRSLTREQELNDALLLKEMNMNAVRCSHYPPDKYFLQVCDSLGIYVLNELAGWQKAYATNVGEKIVKELVLRDQNHPSIIFWDNGNEGGTNKSLDDDFSKWDFQKRPVIHPHHRPGNAFNGIDCNHYEDYYSTQKILNDSLIYMPTEFMHAQDDGGGGAGMEDFWNLHWKSKRSAGGFIWAMVDEAIVRTDLNGILDANGLNANDGILGPHREKEGSYYALREIFSPVKLSLDKHLPNNFNGQVEIENRYHFTNLKNCSFYWALVNFKKVFDASNGYSTMKTGKIESPSIDPVHTGRLNVSLPDDYKNYDALLLVAKDPFGKEIYKWTSTIKSSESLVSFVKSTKKDSTSFSETDSTYSIGGGEVAIVLNKKNGQLITSKNKSNDYVLSFNNGPVLVRGTASCIGSRVYKDSVGTNVEFSYNGNLKKVIWSIDASGWTTMSYQYDLSGDVPFAGISFNYPENYVLGARWLGKGPGRQWKNRLQGMELSVWQNLYNNTQTGYAPAIYPEFKGYYGDVSWMELSTVEGKLYIASKDTGLFVRLFDFYALTGGVKPHPELPIGNISFLDAIPPIGTKLATGLTTNTRVYGPQSELNHVNGLVSRTLYFYFGLPKINTSKEVFTRPLVDNVF